MVRSKQSSSKKPKGVDFKKIKHKIGRKLPPPKNATITQIKSKAIVLPEQSVASERAGLAVNKKGLTLRELLKQTSHYNAKIRKAALVGIRDLVLKYPSELKLHKRAIIEKLRERICDNDKAVRETLYHILKTVIFPCSKEDITGPIISLMMAYVFNAMTHITVDIRLMAFKFLELVVSSYPSSFILHAKEVLDNYVDILRNNQIYLQDKGKLKNALGGLLRCLSLLVSKKEEDDPSYKLDMVGQKLLHTYKPDAPAVSSGISSVIEKDLVPLLVNCFQESISLIRDDAQSFDCMLVTLQCINLAVKIVIDAVNKAHMEFEPFLTSQSNGSHGIRSTMLVLLKKLWQTFPIGQMHESTAKEDDTYFVLNVMMAEIFVHLSDGINDTTFPFAKFLEFVECILLGQVGSNLSSNRALLQKHLGSIISFIPELRAQVVGDWKARLLEAFTLAFKHFKVDSKLFLRYLYAMEEILCNDEPSVRSSDQDLSGHKIAWLQELSKILLHLGDKNPFVSKVVLNLLLKIGQRSVPNSPLALEYDNMQYLLKEFYCTKTISETMLYGPFVKLPPDCQELAIFCLYYIPNLSADILESLACCCLCVDLEPKILLRIVAVLDSAYVAGHLQISYHIGFLVTLVAWFKVFPEKFYVVEDDGALSNRETFKSLTASACRCFQAMGDNSLVLKLMCNVLFNRISLKPRLDNLHGFLKMMVVLDIKLTKLSEDGISKLSDWLSSYLIDAVSLIPENVDIGVNNDQIRVFRYYVQPCLFLFYGSEKLLCYVLKLLDSLTMVDESFSSHSDVKWAPELLSRVHAITSILIFLHNYGKLRRNLSSSIATINHILRNIHNLLTRSNFNMTFEERHKLQCVFDQLKARASKLQGMQLT